jgi:hypothetical protein
MLILDGKTLQYDRAFVHDGVQYPSNWLRLTSLEEKQAIGIVEVPDQPQAVWDQRFYWGVDNPKDHAGLVDLWVSNVKQTAGSLLAPSDWYVTRNAENGSAIPQAVLDRRAEIRTYSNTKETAIQATTTTDELAAYVTSSDFFEWEQPAVVEEPSETTTESSETTTESSETTPEEEVVIFSSSSTTSGFGSSDSLISE